MARVVRLGWGRWLGLVALAVGACDGGDAGITLVDPAVSFQPRTLDFGNRAVGLDHELRTVLSHSGSRSLRVRALRFSPPTDVYLARTSAGPLIDTAFEPGIARELTVVFTPPAAGEYDRTMIVDFGDFQVRLPLFARAEGLVVAKPVVEPAQVVFAPTELGLEATSDVTVRNAGDAPTRLVRVTVGPSQPFSVETGLSSPAFPLLGPGQALDFKVRFRPATPGRFEDELVLVFENGARARFSVAGEGLMPGALQCSTSTVSFDPLPRGTKATEFVSCEATGGPYTLDSVALRPGSSQAFSLLSVPSELDAEGRLGFFVQFQAQGFEATHGGVVEIVARHGASTRMVLDAKTVAPEWGDAELSARLRWNTPATDFDLHLVRDEEPLFGSVDDCYFANKNPDWGQPLNRIDDPFLDRDAEGGFGPEEINLTVAAETQYDLFVQFHGYTGDTVPATSTFVTVFVGGQTLSFERVMLVCGNTWHVGSFRRIGGVLNFEARDVISDAWRPRASERCQ